MSKKLKNLLNNMGVVKGYGDGMLGATLKAEQLLSDMKAGRAVVLLDVDPGTIEPDTETITVQIDANRAAERTAEEELAYDCGWQLGEMSGGLPPDPTLNPYPDNDQLRQLFHLGWGDGAAWWLEKQSNSEPRNNSEETLPNCDKEKR